MRKTVHKVEYSIEKEDVLVVKILELPNFKKDVENDRRFKLFLEVISQKIPRNEPFCFQGEILISVQNVIQITCSAIFLLGRHPSEHTSEFYSPTRIIGKALRSFHKFAEQRAMIMNVRNIDYGVIITLTKYKKNVNSRP